VGDDFIRSQGKPFVAHRLRRSSELIVEQVGTVLARKNLSVPPRGASMLLVINDEGPIGVVEISRRLQLSHPLIVRMAQRFEELGLVSVKKDSADARRKQLVATEKGRAEAKSLHRFNRQLATAFGELFSEIDCDVIELLDRLDAALGATPIPERLRNPKSGEGS
jgi:DNA-binding MarR family transcriptional regulator